MSPCCLTCALSIRTLTDTATSSRLCRGRTRRGRGGQAAPLTIEEALAQDSRMHDAQMRLARSLAPKAGEAM